ncbi:hypothetical protein [uncultured Phycicoccus sp.]|uniref:hypothetical protein n=1 Tax=uncultured Phycicoccus sp. TaxID=661422 RepID=UPI00262E6E52|nr:hypothetical protein [uncultured Phycicoccus sp.]
MTLRSTLTVAASAVALAGSVVMAPAASAEPLVQNGCATMANGVERCVMFFYGPGGGGMGAKASISDTAAGGDFDVKVTDVRLQTWSGGQWSLYLQEDDFDGWHADSDVAKTETRNTCAFPQTRLRVRATFAWRGSDGVVHFKDLVTDGTARAMEC